MHPVQLETSGKVRLEAIESLPPSAHLGSSHGRSLSSSVPPPPLPEAISMHRVQRTTRNKVSWLSAICPYADVHFPRPSIGSVPAVLALDCRTGGFWPITLHRDDMAARSEFKTCPPRSALPSRITPSKQSPPSADVGERPSPITPSYLCTGRERGHTHKVKSDAFHVHIAFRPSHCFLTPSGHVTGTIDLRLGCYGEVRP